MDLIARREREIFAQLDLREIRLVPELSEFSTFVRMHFTNCSHKIGHDCDQGKNGTDHAATHGELRELNF